MDSRRLWHKPFGFFTLGFSLDGGACLFYNLFCCGELRYGACKMIISFIGIRGAGKSTQCALLQSYLNSIGRPAQVVKALDDEIKSRFLDIISANSYMANVFLFCMLYRRQVDQTQMLQQQGYLVITDRFIEYFRLYHTYEGLLTTHSTDL